MSEKVFNSRIVHKHDIESNWNRATNFIPKKGEMIIYDADSTYDYARFKIGDGVTLVSSLPFATDALEITVDSSLSSTSTNPVQNKVVNAAISSLNTLVGDTSVASQITTAVTPKLDAANAAWTQIYDSGAITSEVNSIAGIDVTGYKSLMVAVKCVNTTSTSSSRAGAVIFSGNNQDYAFNNIFSNLLKNGTTTSGAMAKFRIVDGFIICETAMRAITADGILSDTEGAGIDTLAPVSSGLIKCTNAVTTMAVSSAAQSATHFYGVGSRVIVWGCKV